MVGLDTKLTLKTSQGLTLSPQMLQAVQVLQLAKTDLDALIAAECEQNPLLIYEEMHQEAEHGADGFAQSETKPSGEASALSLHDDGSSEAIKVDHEGTSVNLDAPLEAIDPDVLPRNRTGQSGASDSDNFSVEQLSNTEDDLYTHLLQELAVLPVSYQEARLAEALIYYLDPTGYLYEPLTELAEKFGVDDWQVLEALDIVQSLSPTGVGARSLAECLRLQLKEKDRLDPMMDRCLDHLPLLVQADYKALKAEGIRIDQDDLLSILRDLRHLDPKPGLQFSSHDHARLSPDILVVPDPSGGWQVRINPDAQPRLLIDRTYQSRILKHDKSTHVKTYMRDCLNSANGLIKALDQRTTTLVRVATEVIKHQIDFLDCGIPGLKALTLTMVAEALDLHESTISRAVANKTMLTPNGIFALRYFFTHTVGGDAEGEGSSIQVIKHEIRTLIDQENPAKPLSDEKIVKALLEKDIKLARRTVTKYREAMGLGSSSERRKQKRVESTIAKRV